MNAVIGECLAGSRLGLLVLVLVLLVALYDGRDEGMAHDVLLSI